MRGILEGEETGTLTESVQNCKRCQNPDLGSLDKSSRHTPNYTKVHSNCRKGSSSGSLESGGEGREGTPCREEELVPLEEDLPLETI
jgi:hypothetical protein